MNLLIDEMPTFIIESDYKSEDKYNDIELNQYLRKFFLQERNSWYDFDNTVQRVSI